MEKETRYGLDGTTVYTWASTPKDAIATAATFTGAPAYLLVANKTGLVRPGGYEADYNGEDATITTDSYARYAVRIGKGTK